VIFAIELIKGKDKNLAYKHVQKTALEYAEIQGFNPK